MDINLTGNSKQDIELAKLAFEYANTNYSHYEILVELAKEDEVKKAICIINLDTVNSQNEADLLISNLTGKGTLIRELTSFQILDLIKNSQTSNFFQTTKILDTLLMGIVDINPTVSRNITAALMYIENKKYFYELLKNKIFIVLKEIDAIPSYKSNKSYDLNKKIFALYWYLVALNIITKNNSEIENDKEFEDIITKCAEQNEYTIREKTAKILAEIEINKNKNFKAIYEKLKFDENFYVRNQTK